MLLEAVVISKKMEKCSKTFLSGISGTPSLEQSSVCLDALRGQ